MTSAFGKGSLKKSPVAVAMRFPNPAAAMHFFDLAELEIRRKIHDLYENADDTMLAAAAAAMKHNDTLPNSEFVIPERSANAKGTGRANKQDGIKQFPADLGEFQICFAGDDVVGELNDLLFLRLVAADSEEGGVGPNDLPLRARAKNTLSGGFI